MTKSIAFSFVFLLAACSKPNAQQVIKAIQENPSLLADAAKADPDAFRKAMAEVQVEMRKKQQEQETKDTEKYFSEPLKPKLGPEQVFKGNDKAKITIVEYTDFECPYCSRGAMSLAEVLKKYDGKVKVTVKHLPLPFHPKAMPAAQYYEALRIQNPVAAARLHDDLFASQEELKRDGEKYLKARSKHYGANMAKLEKDIKSDAVKKKIEADMAEAREFGFRGTPSFVVGGVPVKGALPPDEFAKVIDRLLK